ncbi:MAG: Ger(x)C family spore germination protein [Clostridium sp.]|uniref:Ger(x)C family spore germination protein n=1 Tax=Clostridium sp. TaxID=1506 RepID=UPI002FC8783D
MTKIFKNIIVSIMLISFTLPLYGCWDYIDSKDIIYVAGMAIDKEDNNYKLTFEVISAGADGKSANSKIVSSEGKTIHEALRDAVKKVGTRLQLSHMKTVILSESIAKEGIATSLDLIERDVELRNDMWILVSKSITASNIINGLYSDQGVASFDIAKALSKPSVIGKYTSEEIFIAAKGFKSYDKATIIPLVDIKKSKELNVGGCGVFSKDVMVGELSEEETLFLSIIREDREADEFVLSVPIGEKDYIGIEFMKIKRKLIPSITNNKPNMDIVLDIDASISEINSTNIKLKDVKSREAVINEAKLYITENINKVLNKLQEEYNSDVIGLGKKFKMSQNKELQAMAADWNKQFKNLNTDLNVKLNIKFTGLTNEVIGTGD